jgi:pyruvate,water dikinase
MSTYVVALDSPEATLERVGGKGANLAELARADFAVPPGFLVTTDAYRAFVRSNRLASRIVDLARAVSPDDPVALEQVSEQIRALFEQGKMPDDIAQAVIDAYGDLRPLPPDARSQAGSGAEETAVAVRSSATAEDLPGLSFAGQQDTYLNIVGEAAVLEAVKRCWGSLWTARAIGYRARNRIRPDDVALAVVVQRLVRSDVSGVLFTANPLTGRRNETVIDASYGLGEAIVSGQVEPDHYVVDPSAWRITGHKLGAKALAIVPRAGGGTDQIARGGDTQALDDAQILELARTAGRIAAHFGTPQDIEWAWAEGRLYILQSRPITSLYPLPETPRTGDQGDHGERVYWSLNSVQGIIDPFTPLGRDVLQKGLATGMFQLLRARRPAREGLVTAGGRLFIDITEISAIWNGVLGGVDPGAKQTLARLVDAGRVMLKNPLTPRKIRELLPTLLPMLLRALAALHAPEYRRAQASTIAERFLERVRAHIGEARTLDQLLASMMRDLPDFVTGVMIHLFPLLAPAIGTMRFVDSRLVEWLGMQPGAVFQLVRGLPGNVTSEMDLRLWAQAQAIRADAAARDFVLTQPVEGLVEAYERHELPPTAQRALDTFMQQYGMRGVGEIDFGRPRWRDDSAPIVQTIQNYLRQGDPDLAPDVMFARGAAESERLAAEWVAQVRLTRFGALRARLLGLAIDRLRKLMGFRESPKFYIIQVFGLYHAALLAQGQRLAAQGGALERPEDIFFVPIDDLRRFARGEQVDLKAIVANERADDERERARRQMPRLLLSSGEVFYGGMTDDGGDGLVGDPVSPGVAEGRAHVVLNPRGVRLEPGEILVCPATDPGWTPLFLTAGGLVMEIGGMVTHGSVVAREYGIPAVVGVHEATKRLQSGQRIRVDGTQGRVTVLEDVPTAPVGKN